MTSPTWAAGMVDDEIAAAAVGTPAQRRPDVVALARAASVAAIVEPALLRRLRLEVPGLAPQGGSLDAGVEADLWFSRLVHVATARQLTLRPAVAEILRDQLSQPQYRAVGHAARKIVADAHRKHPDMVQLEERIIWSTVTGDAGDVERALDRALATIRVGPDRAAEVVRWVMQARRRLPASALNTHAGRKLLATVAMHVDRIIPAQLLTADRFPDSVGDVAPTGLPVTTVAVELAEGGVRFVASDQPNAAMLTVPDTRPLVMEARWTRGDGSERSAVILAEPGSTTALDGLAGPVVLRTIAGRRFLVNSVFTRPERQEPPLERACVLVTNATGVATTGYFVAPDLIATASQSDIGTQPSGYRVRWHGRWLTAAPVHLGRAVMVLRLSHAQEDAAVLTLGPPTARAQDGDTWITLGFTREAEERLTGTVLGGQFMLARTTVLPGLAGAPVMVGGELAGQVRNITTDAAPSGMAVVEVVPADEIRRELDDALSADAGQPAAAEASVPAPASARRGRGTDERPFPDQPEGTDTLPQIDHILVLMMEGHTYDNYLGMLAGRGDGFALGADGRPVATNPAPDGSIQHLFRMPTTCQLAGKPTQDWEQSHIQFNEGRNDGFVKSASGPVAMGYWTGEDLPWAYSLASTFPLATRWFAPVMGQTQPNRRYLLAATSVGMVDDVLPETLLPARNGTIFDRLDVHQIPWRNYYSSLPPTSALFLGQAVRGHSSIVPISQFFADAKSGNLPGFAIIDPDFGASSGGPPQNIVHAEVFAAAVVQAVMESPAWPRTLLVWTFAEGGGYYDHVPPPRAVAPDDIGPLSPATPYDGFARHGFRVPAVVVSPWSRPGYVSSEVYDHTSILKMVERKWNLAPMTRRDAAAADLSSFLDLNRPAFARPPALAAPLAGPAQTACETSGPGQIPPPGSVTQR